MPLPVPTFHAHDLVPTVGIQLWRGGLRVPNVFCNFDTAQVSYLQMAQNCVEMDCDRAHILRQGVNPPENEERGEAFVVVTGIDVCLICRLGPTL